MIHRTAKLTKEELEKVAQLDASIQHWSMQHTHLSMQAKSMLDSISSLEQARNQVLDRAITEAEIDPRTIKQVQVTPDGTINCICSLPPPTPVEPEKNGAVTEPAPPPSAEAAKAVEGQAPTS